MFYSVAQHSVIVAELVALLATERRLQRENGHWPELDGVEPLDLELTAWAPDDAARASARRYAEVDARR